MQKYGILGKFFTVNSLIPIIITKLVAPPTIGNEMGDKSVLDFVFTDANIFVCRIFHAPCIKPGCIRDRTWLLSKCKEIINANFNTPRR